MLNVRRTFIRLVSFITYMESYCERFISENQLQMRMHYISTSNFIRVTSASKKAIYEYFSFCKEISKRVHQNQYELYVNGVSSFMRKRVCNAPQWTSSIQLCPGQRLVRRDSIYLFMKFFSVLMCHLISKASRVKDI